MCSFYVVDGRKSPKGQQKKNTETEFTKKRTNKALDYPKGVDPEFFPRYKITCHRR